MVYKPARINFTDAQIKAAISGKPIRFKAHQLNSGDKVVLLHPANHANYHKAAMKGKGVTITISPAEILSTVESDMDGTGFFGDLWKKIKSGYNWVKHNIIDTPLYQQTIKPLVRTAVNAGATALSGMAPELAPAIMMAKDQIGSKTGAFGAPLVLRRKKIRGGSFRLN